MIVLYRSVQHSPRFLALLLSISSSCPDVAFLISAVYNYYYSHWLTDGIVSTNSLLVWLVLHSFWSVSLGIELQTQKNQPFPELTHHPNPEYIDAAMHMHTNQSILNSIAVYNLYSNINLEDGMFWISDWNPIEARQKNIRNDWLLYRNSRWCHSTSNRRGWGDRWSS